MSKRYLDNKSWLKPLFGVNINPSTNVSDEAFELAKTSDNLGRGKMRQLVKVC